MSTVAGAKAREVPPEVLSANAITWLGETVADEKADEIKIMSLSCRLCLDELVDVLAGTQEAPRHLLLNTTDATDFGIAWNWVTAVLAQSDENLRRSTAIELLAIYVDSPMVYLNQPDVWRELCLERWMTSGCRFGKTVNRRCGRIWKRSRLIEAMRGRCCIGSALIRR